MSDNEKFKIPNPPMIPESESDKLLASLEEMEIELAVDGGEDGIYIRFTNGSVININDAYGMGACIEKLRGCDK